MTREVGGLHEAAYLLAIFAFLTQVLAFLRDRIFASYFGAGQALDMYYAAFKIPDLLFVIATSLMSVYVLVPFVTARMEDRVELKRFMGSMFTLLGALLAIGSGIVFFLTPYLTSVFFPGFNLGEQAMVVILTRILLLQTFLLGISNLFSSLTQTFKRFVIIAAAPLLYNLGIIIGALVLYPYFGLPGLALGAMFGALLHLFLQIPFMAREGLWPTLALPRMGELKEVLALSIPRTASLAANNAALLVYAALASLLPAGSLAIFTFAYNLQNAPITIIALSYSVAAFPALAALMAKGEREAFITKVLVAARHIIFWTLPAIALIVVLRAHIVRVVLGSGAFDWTDTRLTAAALAIFALSLTAHGLILLIVRAYYAAGNTKTPLLATFFAVPVGILSAYYFLHLFSLGGAFAHTIERLLRVEGLPGTSALMLPLGYTTGIFVHAIVLALLFGRDFGGFWRGISGTLIRSLIASIIGGVASYSALKLLAPLLDINTFLGVFGQGCIAGLVGVFAIVCALKILRSPELEEAEISFHTKFWKTKTIVTNEES